MSITDPMAKSDNTLQLDQQFDLMQTTFKALRENSRNRASPTLTDRLAKLKELGQTIRRSQRQIETAISADFRHRSTHETKMADIYTVLSTIQYTRKNLKEWMAPRPRTVSFPFAPAQAHVLPQPLGVVAILSPWNYPFSLALIPFISALAAGNRIFLKPSEHTPRTGALLKEMIETRFPADWASVTLGDANQAGLFCTLPFDHLFFTGSTRVGRAVMKAASENLVPVTLELGGKSPALIHGSYPLGHAVKRIVAGKFLNAGQTCIAPDYVLVPEDQCFQFIKLLKQEIAECYPNLIRNPDYTAIINQHQYERLNRLIAQADDQGGQIIRVNPGNENPDNEKIVPTLITNINDEMDCMKEEIFGPILPIVPYRHLDEAIDYINSKPRPLALYYFDHNQKRIKQILHQTTSGGVCVNDTILHVVQDDLPFGGVGASGMGRYHGREGFDTFSNLKSIFHQSKLNGAALLNPPYGRKTDLLLKAFTRRS